MLPSANRMRRSADFTSVLRSGRRARGRLVVVHQRAEVGAAPGGRPAVVGLIVSRSVGASVVRHRVSRRLRHVMGSRLDRLPAGSGTVIRALPASATADSADLARDLDRMLGRVVPRSGPA